MKTLSLTITHPKLASEWLFSKNCDLTPDNVTYGSNKKPWWICEKGHEYRAKICHRVSGSKCPFCHGKKLAKERSLSHKRPDLAKEFHPTKNEALTADQIHASSRKEVWWQCSKDIEHEWKSTVDNRSKGNGCPYCKNRGGKVGKGKSFGDLYKDLVIEWNFEKNVKTPYDFAPTSNEKVSWTCKEGHEWETAISHRANGTKCPYCAGNKVTKKKSLGILHPHLISEWHKDLNDVSPFDITPGSNKKIYWQCINDTTHTWKTSCWERVSGSGCPHCVNGWSLERIRLFVLSLLPYLETFDQAELMTLCKKNGAWYSQGKGRDFIKEFVSGKFLTKELEEVVYDQINFFQFIENQTEAVLNSDIALPTISEMSSIKRVSAENDFPIVKTKDVLAAVDSNFIASTDEETIEFFIKSAVAKIWRHAFNNEKEALEHLKFYKPNGEYSQKVRKLFLSGFEGAKRLKIPNGYNSIPPRNLPKKEDLGLMQRYVAYQIKKLRRFGNWSGTGAGKTLSAVLASRVIKARLTIILCPNNVIDTWTKQIQGTYPNSKIYKKESLSLLCNNSDFKYLILNYEFFQQKNVELKLRVLVESYIVDLVVIDEIHYSKQRIVTTASKRKRTISWFLCEISRKNQNLCVLGMSATPVINGLFEGKTLLELTTGRQFDSLDTKATVSNAVALYTKFITHGIRYMPAYALQFNLKIEKIDCSTFIEEIKSHKTILDLEIILTKAKLPFILQNLKPKTIIYSHYRDGIDSLLAEAIAEGGWSVVLYNGDTKEGLQEFVEGKADILLASSCIGTGVDGLQMVCNRLIINCLPWTHAEFEQLKGRIYRQGQRKDYVEIFVPLTFATINGETRSWCESRWKRIQFKKSLANAAVDGTIPEGQLRSIDQAHRDLMQWLERLDTNRT